MLVIIVWGSLALLLVKFTIPSIVSGWYFGRATVTYATAALVWDRGADGSKLTLKGHTLTTKGYAWQRLALWPFRPRRTRK